MLALDNLRNGLRYVLDLVQEATELGEPDEPSEVITRYLRTVADAQSRSRPHDSNPTLADRLNLFTSNFNQTFAATNERAQTDRIWQVATCANIVWRRMDSTRYLAMFDSYLATHRLETMVDADPEVIAVQVKINRWAEDMKVKVSTELIASDATTLMTLTSPAELVGSRAPSSDGLHTAERVVNRMIADVASTREQLDTVEWVSTLLGGASRSFDTLPVEVPVWVPPVLAAAVVARKGPGQRASIVPA